MTLEEKHKAFCYDLRNLLYKHDLIINPMYDSLFIENRGFNKLQSFNVEFDQRQKSFVLVEVST